MLGTAWISWLLCCSIMIVITEATDRKRLAGQSYKGRSVGGKVRYDGYRVERVTPASEDQVKELWELEKLGASFWNDPGMPGKPVDIMFPPNLTLPDKLRSGGAKVHKMVEDVQRLIDATEKNIRNNDNLTAFTSYATLEKINAFLHEVAAQNSSIASVKNIGKSYEGRDMFVLKIATGPSPKPAIWLDSLIHAREWITGAVSTFLINELVRGSNVTIRGWLKDFDFYILPALNPDGYVYTHTTNRLWRKSRKPNENSAQCEGVDQNRNWGYKWGGDGIPEPCSETYPGPEAFSEVENRNARDFINSIKDHLVAYISLHSYGQYILFPWAWTANERIPQYETYKSLGNKVVKAIAGRNGTKFESGTVYELLYVIAGGSSMDWAKGTLNLNLTWTFEMRDKGDCGFVLPPEQIIPSALEFLDGFAVIVDALRAGIPRRHHHHCQKRKKN